MAWNCSKVVIPPSTVNCRPLFHQTLNDVYPGFQRAFDGFAVA